MIDYSEFVPQVHFEQIPIKNLVSNQDYQRNLSVKHVQKAADNFDLYQINPVKVSRRNGVNYVFNGQHTIEIVALVSGSRDTPVWCMVYDDLDYEEEADIFANQLKYTKALLPYEIFMANIEAGNDKQLMIKALVESYGLKISNGKKPGGICAIASLEEIMDRYGYHCLDRTMRLCIGTWEGDANSFSANMLKGIATLVNAYGDSLNDELFKEKLSVVSLKEIIRNARERQSGSMGYAEALLTVYNKKMKNALKWSTLYSNRRKKRTGFPEEYEEELRLAEEQLCLDDEFDENSDLGDSDEDN